MDDVSMPEVNKWGDQPTCELVRQLIESGGFFFSDRTDKDKRGDFKNVERVSYVAAMDLPGAGRSDIPNRLRRHFFPYHVVTPMESTLSSIYSQLLSARFDHLARNRGSATAPSSPGKNGGGPKNDLASFISRIPTATMALFKWAREEFLPSPKKRE